jgi:hypothetical protein
LKARGNVDDPGARAGVQAESIGNGEVASLHGTPPAIGENKKPRRNATGYNRWSADSSVGSANSFSDQVSRCDRDDFRPAGH